MWLFEIHEDLRAGFGVVLKSGYAGVLLGFDEETKAPLYLPLGNSIERALRHPLDHDIPFRLHRAALEHTTAGLMLVKQTFEEAKEEGKALVLVDGNTDASLGVTQIERAHGRSMPQLETYVSDSCATRRLYVFNKGDALFVSWSARSLNARAPRRFIIEWDGAHLRLQKKTSRPPQVRRQPRFAPAMSAEETTETPLVELQA